MWWLIFVLMVLMLFAPLISQALARRVPRRTPRPWTLALGSALSAYWFWWIALFDHHGYLLIPALLLAIAHAERVVTVAQRNHPEISGEGSLLLEIRARNLPYVVAAGGGLVALAGFVAFFV